MRSKAAIIARQRQIAARPHPQERIVDVGSFGGSAVGGAETFQLLEVVTGGKLLRGRRWDGTYNGSNNATGVATEDVYIARCDLLRNETGRTFTKNAVSYAPTGEQTRDATMPDTTVIAESIVPPYTVPSAGNYPGDKITAVRVKSTGLVDPDDGNPVVWVEVNDGRVWAGACTE